MTSTPLRRRLFLLAAAGIVPLAILAGVSLYLYAREQRAQSERIAVEITRALSTAVDFELRRSVSVLEALATSPALDGEDVSAFRVRAKRMLAVDPGWSALLLVEENGRIVFEAREGAGGALGPDAWSKRTREIARRERAPVPELFRDERGAYAVLVSVPVVRGGVVTSVLSAALEPETIGEVIERQRLPDDWVVSVFDAQGLRVARSKRHLEYLGTPAAPTLAELMAGGGESGSGLTHTLEGDAVYTAYTHLPSGWSVAIGIPPSVVEVGERSALAILGGGLLLSISLGLVVALVVARSIVEPMDALRAAARALGRRQPIVEPESRIEEIRQVSSALRAAGEERAGAEREREDLLVREREARAAAEAASRAKDEFLAMLGHELRNPIGAIANASQVLDHPDVDAASAERARHVIRRQVDHLAKLMDDLLDAGRAILGKIALDREPVDLAETIRRAVATLRAAGQLERHPVSTALESVWVEADPTRLEQIATNLLTNAVRYTPAGGGVRVTVGAEGAEAVFRVADDGIGMSAELLERAFDLFVQGDQQLDRAQGGLGIGLTLVRRLAELQGGSAVAESAGPGLGTEVVVRLPAIAAPESAAPAPAAESPLGCDVLVVEDNADAREMLRALLELGGHRVRTAEDGEAGVAAVETFRPEVVLVDLGLPKLDGYEVARRIRARAAGGRRPLLVALTGYGLAEDRDRALAAGFDAHVVKPADETSLREIFARARTRRDGAAA
jgi:signal transduction histidine kinase/CheY-like chemotaxis protein